MKKKTRILSGIMMVALLCGGCGTRLSSDTRLLSSGKVDTMTQRYSMDTAFKDAYLDFSFQALEGCMKKDDNLMISPLSIQSCIAMVALGATETTKEQLEKNMMGGLETEVYCGTMAYYIESLDESGVSLANSIWFKDTEDFRVKNIAKSLYVSESKVKTSLFRSRVHLETILRKEGFELW